MPDVFLIGDTHFGHEKILQFEKEHRPFGTIEEHDEALVSNWNSVVGKNDVVWHLGDVLWTRRAFPLLGRLNGRKYLVLGNHDSEYPTVRWLEHFVRVSAAEEFDGGVLTHIPIHPYQKYRYSMNIHGHTHDNVVTEWKEVETGIGMMTEEVPDPFYWNVSCEQVNLTPISYEVLKKRHTQHA